MVLQCRNAVQGRRPGPASTRSAASTGTAVILAVGTHGALPFEQESLRHLLLRVPCVRHSLRDRVARGTDVRFGSHAGHRTQPKKQDQQETNGSFELAAHFGNIAPGASPAM